MLLKDIKQTYKTSTHHQLIHTLDGDLMTLIYADFVIS
jgi:hypothetical protein